MTDPFIRFQRPSLPPAAAIERYLAVSRERQWFSNSGPCARLLAERLSIAAGAHCVPVASATAGLLAAVAALDTSQRGHGSRYVLMPSFAFPAAAQAAVWNGLEPVFLDVDLGHWHLDPDALRTTLDQLGRDVAIVIALSSFGTPPPMAIRREWEDACAKAGVPLLVDSAAGFGAVGEDGVPTGAQGTVEVVSFHATKPLAAGEGGAVFTKDPALASKLARIVNFGFDERREVIEPMALNAKLSEPAAAIALAALDRFPDQLRARRDRAFAVLEPLKSELTPQVGHERGTWQFVPVLAADSAARETVLAAAAPRRLEVRTYYDPLHRMAAFTHHRRHGTLRRTEELAARMLSLPMAVDLTEDEIDAITAMVLEGIHTSATASE